MTHPQAGLDEQADAPPAGSTAVDAASAGAEAPRQSPVQAFIRTQLRHRRGSLAMAALCGAVLGAASTLLLGLSGWFLAAAGIAGLAGAAVATQFNYLLPAAGMRGLSILRTAGRYGEKLCSHRAALQGLAALRPALFAGIAAAPPARSLRLSSGEASARLVQDVNAIEAAFVRRSAPWLAAAAMGAAAAVMARASLWAPLVFLSGMWLQIAVGRGLAARWTRTPGRDQLRATGKLKDTLTAYLPAWAELHCFNLLPRAVQAIMASDAALARSARRRNDAEAAMGLVEQLLAALTLVGVAVCVAGGSTPDMALALLAAIAGMEGSGALLRAAQQEGSYREAVARLDDTVEAAAMRAPPAGAPSTRATPAGAPATRAPPAGTGDPRPDPGPVLQLHGRRFAPGSHVGIRGPSGSGKTAMLQALLGLAPDATMDIRVNGQPLNTQPAGWTRHWFAYAPQDAHLLTGTVADNLRMAQPQADDAALWKVLACAQLDARVRRLPRQLDTWIGDGGQHLSGGEQHRLALARALLRPAPWLLLDEPTEGLDRETEARVVAALSHWLQHTGQGMLLVSHRPAPLQCCTEFIDMPH